MFALMNGFNTHAHRFHRHCEERMEQRQENEDAGLSLMMLAAFISAAQENAPRPMI